MNWRCIFALLVACLLASDSHGAQEDTVLVEVFVTAISGQDVYIDAGRLVGIEPGDQVQFHGAATTATAIVRAVSKSSSRAELNAISMLAVGDRGEVRIPSSRVSKQAPAPNLPKNAPTIEWSAKSLPWDEDQPLLSQVAVRLPESRPSVLSGRLFSSFDQTWDNQRNQSFLLIRQGIDATLTNPFDDGGELHLDVEGFERKTKLPTQTLTDTRGRIDRFSYSWGGTRERATHFEVGRFLQSEFSVLGVLDGFEVSKRTSSGSRYGTSLGYFPNPRSDFRTGDDVQSAFYYRSAPVASDASTRLDWGVALQNTWHLGVQDRNLLVGEIDYQPIDRLSLSLDSLVDYYGNRDVAKSGGFELTELNLRTRYKFESQAGLGAFFSHRRWPELLRQVFTSLTPQQLRDNRLRRVGIDGWAALSKKFRLSARVGAWRDQSTSGSSASTRLSARNWLYDRGEVALDLYQSEGEFNRNDGVRLTANHQFASSLAGLVYDRSTSKQSGFVGGLSKLSTQRLRLNWDITINAWSISTYVESRFGDQQDAFVAGLSLQYRF